MRGVRRLAPWCFAALGLLGCGSLLGLNDLHKAQCADVEGCLSDSVGGGNSQGGDGTSAGTTASGGMNAPGNGGSSSGGTHSGGSSSLGGAANGGTANAGSAGTLGSAGSGGAVDGPGPAACPGGAIPPSTWTEHWFEHNQVLKRVYYDDCVAVYFDNDMDPAAAAWINPFISKAWTYALATYGKMGPGRLFAVFHQAKYGGGHSAAYYEASHDNRNTTDGGQTTWSDGDYDLPAHLMGFVVESTATHSKYGSPDGALGTTQGVAEIFKYDLYSALNMTTFAADALTKFNADSSGTPAANTYWFRDWFYPIWRDHGKAAALTRYYTLLQKYFPTGADNTMPDMNFGEYVHFMSGAANTDLQPLAKTAFGWTTDWNNQLAKAKADYPAITY